MELEKGNAKMTPQNNEAGNENGTRDGDAKTHLTNKSNRNEISTEPKRATFPKNSLHKRT